MEKKCIKSECFLENMNEALNSIKTLGFDDEVIRSRTAIADELDVRICTSCSNLMDNGFLFENQFKTYCSEECMEGDGISEADYNAAYERGEAFYTEWF